MRARFVQGTLLGIVTLAIGGGLVLAGRATMNSTEIRDHGYQAGRNAGYADGVAAGEAEGQQEGRALQEGSSLSPGSAQPTQDAFNAGYVAGATDVFGGYDGGWATSLPYVVTLASGNGPLTYRIAGRTPLQAHVTYFLCADGHSLCQRAPS